MSTYVFTKRNEPIRWRGTGTDDRACALPLSVVMHGMARGVMLINGFNVTDSDDRNHPIFAILGNPLDGDIRDRCVRSNFIPNGTMNGVADGE
jgi:hypothetical protein